MLLAIVSSMSALGQKQTSRPEIATSALYPQSGHRLSPLECPLGARRRHMQLQQTRPIRIISTCKTLMLFDRVKTEELGVGWAKVLFVPKVTYIRVLSRSTTPEEKHSAGSSNNVGHHFQAMAADHPRGSPVTPAESEWASAGFDPAARGG